MTLHGIPPLFPAPPDVPGDVVDGSSAAAAPAGFASVFEHALAVASDSLDRAGASERTFATGRGGLQQMILDRAQADVALSIASAAASRTTQALSTILAMQI